MFGFSLYLDQDKEYILKKIYDFKDCDILFTSLHYPSDDSIMAKFYRLLEETHKLNMEICVDVNNRIVDKFPNLLDNDIVFRLDYGFSYDRIARLSKYNRVAINASTVTYEDLEYLKNFGCDFSKISAWYNYYPLPYTGMSGNDVIRKNKIISQFGLKIFAFFQGDKDLRGPLYKTLPSLEEDRKEDPFYSYLKLKRFYGIDNLLVSEGLTHNSKKFIENYENKKIINLEVILDKDFKKLKEIKVRKDINEYLIRNERDYKFIGKIDNSYIKKGDILILNKNSNRYSGEIEIARKNLGFDNTRNIIGKVKNLNILNLIEGGDRIVFNRISKWFI